MDITEYAQDIISELDRTLKAVSPQEVERLADLVLAAKRIFVAGAGRSGFVAQAFAMRLMHLGFTAYVVGETVTPAIKPDDLLVIGSGSGATTTLVAIADKAKTVRGKSCACDDLSRLAHRTACRRRRENTRVHAEGRRRRSGRLGAAHGIAVRAKPADRPGHRRHEVDGAKGPRLERDVRAARESRIGVRTVAADRYLRTGLASVRQGNGRGAMSAP